MRTYWHKNTPLHCAVTSENGGLVKILVEAGANYSIKNNSGDTPLDWAEKKDWYNGQYDTIVELLETAE